MVQSRFIQTITTRNLDPYQTLPDVLYTISCTLTTLGDYYTAGGLRPAPDKRNGSATETGDFELTYNIYNDSSYSFPAPDSQVRKKNLTFLIFLLFVFSNCSISMLLNKNSTDCFYFYLFWKYTPTASFLPQPLKFFFGQCPLNRNQNNFFEIFSLKLKNFTPNIC